MDNACPLPREVRNGFRCHCRRQYGDPVRCGALASCSLWPKRAVAGARAWRPAVGRMARPNRAIGAIGRIAAIAAIAALAAMGAIPVALAGTNGDGVRLNAERSEASGPQISNAGALRTGIPAPHAARIDPSMLGRQLRALDAPTFGAQTLPAGVLSSTPLISPTADGAARSATSNDKIDFSGADARASRWRIEPRQPGMPGTEGAFPDESSPWYAHRCPDYAEGSRIQNINRMAAGGEPYVACKPR